MCLIEESLQKICMRQNNNKPVLGGNGVIVIVDLLKFHTDMQPYNKYLIGMAEIKEIPIRTHFEYTEYNNKIDLDHFIEMIKTSVAPGSWLVFEDRIFVDDYHKMLDEYYPVITMRSNLEKHNTNEQNVIHNLTTVWNIALKSLL